MSLTTSVIITNYNQGRFFKQALLSALNQTRKPLEIIVVDDKSTDDSVKTITETLRLFEGRTGIPDLHFLKREVNGKPAGARNTGIAAAKGDVIAFLDVDDYYHPQKIEKSLEVLERYEHVGLVYTDYMVEDTRINSIRREFKHPYEYQYLWQACIVSTDSIMRKQVFDTVGTFNEQLFGVEDYEMWLRIAKRFYLFHLPEALFTYRLHGQNITLNHAESMAQQIAKFKQEMQNAKSTT